jgi:hypothetical protein
MSASVSECQSSVGASLQWVPAFSGPVSVGASQDFRVRGQSRIKGSRESEAVMTVGQRAVGILSSS